MLAMSVLTVTDAATMALVTFTLCNLTLLTDVYRANEQVLRTERRHP